MYKHQIHRREFLGYFRTGAFGGMVFVLAVPRRPALAQVLERPSGQQARESSALTPVSLFPVDRRCALLSNRLWTKDSGGFPSLSGQHLWVQFPSPKPVYGVNVTPDMALGHVRFETSPDAGRTWQLLAEREVPNEETSIRWTPRTVDNIRVVISSAPNPVFPMQDYLIELEVLCDSQEFDLPSQPSPELISKSAFSADRQPVAGSDALKIGERVGRAHRSPETDRVRISTRPGEIRMDSPILHVDFSRDPALIRSLGWDLGARGNERDNLLSTANTQGAFPVVARDCRRLGSDTGGSKLVVRGRSVAYEDISIVPELRQSLRFLVREHGFTATIQWNCAKAFRTHEIAALRFPFDLYRCVTAVLATPAPIGPSGLVKLPLVIQAPNHGTMRVTIARIDGGLPVYGRVSPFRVHAELWLDLIVGAQPLENGLFEVPQGEGEVVLDFELTKIFPFANTDLFTHWERPPFYSFVDREKILGALPNEWLSGLTFRPELGRFANNSVAEAATISASYYADMAAYTPRLADGLEATDLVRFAADQLLRDRSTAPFGDHTRFPQVLASPVDYAWLVVATTGDWDWMSQRRNELKHCAEAMLSREFQRTGIVHADASRIPEQSRSAMWLDSIRSGHLESYASAFCFRAAVRAAELLVRLEERDISRRLREMAQRAQENYWPTFYDPKERRLAMWVDVNGTRYDFDSHAHLGAAIVCDLAPPNLARQLLTEYLSRLDSMDLQSYQYGLPILLDPIPPRFHNDWIGKGVEKDGTDQVGVYQNGSLTHHQCHWILQAMYKLGLRHQANNLFIKLTPRLRQGAEGISGGLHSGIDWRFRDGRPSGYEGLLGEQHHFLLAAITGYLGFELTIDGLRLNPQISALTSERVRIARPNFARMAEDQ